MRDQGLFLECENSMLNQMVSMVQKELVGERQAAQKVWDSLQGSIEGREAKTVTL